MLSLLETNNTTLQGEANNCGENREHMRQVTLKIWPANQAQWIFSPSTQGLVYHGVPTKGSPGSVPVKQLKNEIHDILFQHLSTQA